MTKTKSYCKEIINLKPKLEFTFKRNFGSVEVKKRRLCELKSKQRLEGWERDELRILTRSLLQNE